MPDQENKHTFDSLAFLQVLHLMYMQLFNYQDKHFIFLKIQQKPCCPVGKDLFTVYNELFKIKSFPTVRWGAFKA